MSNVLNLVSEGTFTEQTDGIVNAINKIGGGSVTVDTEMSDTSENAVQNKVIKEYVDALAPFVVTMTQSGDIVTGDKTFAEVKTAADNGRVIIIKINIEGVMSQVLYGLGITNIVKGGAHTLYYATDTGIETLIGGANDYPTVTLS